MVSLKVSKNLLSLTEARIVEVEAVLGKNVDINKLEFQFGGKRLSAWKKWTGQSNFDGDPFITIIEKPHLIKGTTTIKAVLKFDLLFNRESLANRTIRSQYQKFIGIYELALVDPESKTKASATVKLNVYDEFLFYHQLKPEIDEIFKQAKRRNNRYLKYKSLGKSVQGRDLHFVILAKDETAVEKYLNETLPIALEQPGSLLEKLKNGHMGKYKVPIWFNNIHPDEVEGPDAQVELLKKFALMDKITFQTIRQNGQKEIIDLNVNEILDDIILLFMFTNNPDGRVKNTRRNANGIDLNRDNHFQTQPESILVTEEIAKWTPLSFLDMHGYINGFLIEPATPPHNPNYEYDLLYENMIRQAHAMGQAGLGNSSFKSYTIPALDYEGGWDDMSVGYTPMYAMLQGSLGHTIEIPALSQDGFNAMVGVGLGAVHFIKKNKDQLYKKQLEIFQRGVTGEDNDAVDKYLVNSSGKSIGRIRKGYKNFFPDYYLIPIGTAQKNKLEAYKMVQYLLRNGVKVLKTTKKIKVNGTIYSKGTFLIPMKQAKRGVANAMLYKGDNISDWKKMYDSIVVNFPDLRGFTVLEIREDRAIGKNVIKVKTAATPAGKITANTRLQVLSNTNNDTIKIVNELLKKGVTVEKATETKGGVNRGDFIVRTEDLQTFSKNYFIQAKPLDDAILVKTAKLKRPKVAVSGSDFLKYVIKELGFDMVKQKEADVIISDSSSLNETNLSGKRYVGIGLSALSAVKKSGLLPGYHYDYTKNDHEGLVKAKLNSHLLTSGYSSNELFYVTSGSWITSVPAGAEVLATFSSDNDFFVSGWWPGHEKAKSQILAFTHQVNDTVFTLFANDPAFRAHTHYSYRLLANCIFS